MRKTAIQQFYDEIQTVFELFVIPKNASLDYIEGFSAAVVNIDESIDKIAEKFDICVDEPLCEDWQHGSCNKCDAFNCNNNRTTHYTFPCAIGDTIYYVNTHRPIPEIETYICYGFQITKHNVYVQIGINLLLDVQDVCTTYRQAEFRLKEMCYGKN